MSNMYYEREPQSASSEVPCVFSYRGNRLTFQTDAGVFSKGELDQGTRLLLDALPEMTGDVLDLGCGWGAIGIAVKKAFPDVRMTMVDVNLRALGLCEKNAKTNGAQVTCLESDGLSALAGMRFDAIITNPPIRAGKQKVYEMLKDAAHALRESGALYLVIRKQQGAESCMRFLSEMFGTVEKLDRSAGFWVIRAADRKQETEE